jgi:hypothetical protein
VFDVVPRILAGDRLAYREAPVEAHPNGQGGSDSHPAITLPGMPVVRAA